MLEANLHSHQTTNLKAQPRRKWRAQCLEQNQEGSINIECKTHKHKVISKSQRNTKCNIRSKAKKSPCLKKQSVEKTMPKNHGPWKTTVPKSKAKKPRCLKKHSAQKQHWKTMVFEKAHYPQTTLRNHDIWKSAMPKNNVEKPQHLRKHKAQKQYQETTVLEKA